MASKVNFGMWINRSLDLYKNNFGILVLATLVAGLVSMVTAGILGGPMQAGVFIVVIALLDRKDPKPTVGTIFDGFQYFLQMLLFAVVWGVVFIAANSALSAVVCVGSVISLVGSFFLGALIMFGPLLIIEKGMDFWPASMKSIEIVKQDLMPTVGYFAVAAILGGLGSIACGVGAIFTMPITYCMIVVAYRAMTADMPDDESASETPASDTAQPEEAAPAEEAVTAEEAAPAEAEESPVDDEAPAEGGEAEEKTE